MALLGTHIRFALDVKDDFGINDLDKYISGTVYPDSRYVSKIDREKTHSKKFLNKDFYKDDDFKKGWFVHLLCDEIQAKVFENMFFNLLAEYQSVEEKKSAEYWTLKTTFKILQDIYDVSQFSIKDCLKYLKCKKVPNDEKEEELVRYHQILTDLYKKNESKEEDYFDMWLGLGINKELIGKIKNRIKKMNSNKEIIEKIPLIYPEMLNEFLIYIKNIS